MTRTRTDFTVMNDGSFCGPPHTHSVSLFRGCPIRCDRSFRRFIALTPCTIILMFVLVVNRNSDRASIGICAELNRNGGTPASDGITSGYAVVGTRVQITNEFCGLHLEGAAQATAAGSLDGASAPVGGFARIIAPIASSGRNPMIRAAS